MTITRCPHDRLLAVDLRDLPDSQMAALRQAAIREGVPLTDLLARLIEAASERLLASTDKEAA
jgi:hypothetical protein